jgi:hypothetical protein
MFNDGLLMRSRVIKFNPGNSNTPTDDKTIKSEEMVVILNKLINTQQELINTKKELISFKEKPKNKIKAFIFIYIWSILEWLQK